MAETITLLRKDVEKLKERIVNLERKIQNIEELEAEPVSEEEEKFFMNVLSETRGTEFWHSKDKLKENGINI